MEPSRPLRLVADERAEVHRCLHFRRDSARAEPNYETKPTSLVFSREAQVVWFNWRTVSGQGIFCCITSGGLWLDGKCLYSLLRNEAQATDIRNFENRAH
jgi:hypothetical protein